MMAILSQPPYDKKHISTITLWQCALLDHFSLMVQMDTKFQEYAFEKAICKKVNNSSRTKCVTPAGLSFVWPDIKGKL